jgi:hypothetical protein
LGKTCIKKDRIRGKAEEESIENKRQELRDFVTRRITLLREEQEDQSKKPGARELVVEVK